MLNPTSPASLSTLPAKPLRWQRTQYSPLARQRDIFLSAGILAWQLWRDRALGDRGHSGHSRQHRHRRAQWLVGTLLDLGPTFIKIGQALSTRGDLLPMEYVQALGQLQDQVPEFSPDEAIAIIEAELGRPLHTLYRNFDTTPLAAASLGQVHRAKLHSGEEVVVKVQRPGLDKLFDLDFRVLEKLVRFSQRYLPWTRSYELEAIHREFATILYREIDYVQEAMNADRFRFNFRDQPRIRAPKVYPQLTTKKVLTMEYLPGIKINDRNSLEACGLSVQDINQLGICCYLKQLLQDGFFQADPHPGNMAVSRTGDLIFYDFGMMAEVPSMNRDQMVRTFFAVMRKDTDQVINTLVGMGLITPTNDMTAIRRVMSFTLEKFTEKPLELQEFNQVRTEVVALFEQQPFRLPANMTFILKALTTLDGVARHLDPQYSLMYCAKPFIQSLTLAKGPGGLGELAKQARAFVALKLRQPSAAEQLLQRLEERIEQGEFEIRVRSLETERSLRSVNLALRTLIYAYMTGFTLLAGAVLLVGGWANWAIAVFVLSGLSGVGLLRSVVVWTVRDRLDRLAAR
jgi:predicted unusual protein kinase regulating ubiquinone biosynthesis (AarF/ABC1/UbiB family)